MGGVCADTVYTAGDDKGEELLPCPQRFRLQDGWLRHATVPGGQEHQ